MKTEEEIKRQIEYIKSNSMYPAFGLNSQVEALEWTLRDSKQE